METETETNGNGKTDMVKSKGKEGLVEFSGKVKRFPGWFWQAIWKVGQEDPRRIIHAVKVGLSLTLVSLLYLMEPLFKGIGSNAIWAVMTVVVVLEFTAGATLYKGLNRGLGTLLAGSLAFFIELISNASGNVFHAVFIGTVIFLIGAACTYMRFFPYIKKNYDYGVVIFLLTFNLLTVSSYRVENVIQIARDRFFTIAIGCVICLLMSLLVFPIWSCEDLHTSTVRKLEGLAKSIEACVNEYFNYSETEEQEKSSEDRIHQGYKTVLDSKSSDEALALYASWEPTHSKHRFPWQQYVKVGAVLRQIGYTVVALHGCLQSEIQAPRSVRVLFKDPCIRLAREVTKALMELANSVRNRQHCSPEILSDALQEALQDLNSAIQSQPRLFLGSKSNRVTNMPAPAPAPAGNKENERKLLPQSSKVVITSLDFSEALPFAAFASLLVEVVARLDNVIEEVEELGRLGRYKEYDPEENKILVKCEKPPMLVSQNQLPTHTPE